MAKQTTTLNDVMTTINKYWSPVFVEVLRARFPFLDLVNREYEGQIGPNGNTVVVNMITKKEGQTLDIDGNGGGSTFETSKLETVAIEVKANKRFVSGYKFNDIVKVQSMIKDPNSELRQIMEYEINEQINKMLYGLVKSTTFTNDIVIPNGETISVDTFKAARIASGKNHWSRVTNRYALLDPEFYTEMTFDKNLNRNAVDNLELSAGEKYAPVGGFKCIEDDSLMFNEGAGQCGLFFDKDFLLLALQTAPRFKVSDLHSNNEFAYQITVDIVGGCALNHEAAKKAIKVTVADS